MVHTYTHTRTISYHRFLQSQRVIDQSSFLSLRASKKCLKTVTRQAQKDHKTGAQALRRNRIAVLWHIVARSWVNAVDAVDDRPFWTFHTEDGKGKPPAPEKTHPQKCSSGSAVTDAMIQGLLWKCRCVDENQDWTSPLVFSTKSQTTGGVKKYNQSFDDYCIHFGRHLFLCCIGFQFSVFFPWEPYFGNILNHIKTF